MNWVSSHSFTSKTNANVKIFGDFDSAKGVSEILFLRLDYYLLIVLEYKLPLEILEDLLSWLPKDDKTAKLNLFGKTLGAPDKEKRNKFIMTEMSIGVKTHKDLSPISPFYQSRNINRAYGHSLKALGRLVKLMWEIGEEGKKGGEGGVVCSLSNEAAA